MLKPRHKKFKFFEARYWLDPTFGPSVSIHDKDVPWKYEIEADVTPQEMARELRRIADWLEKPRGTVK